MQWIWEEENVFYEELCKNETLIEECKQNCTQSSFLTPHFIKKDYFSPDHKISNFSGLGFYFFYS